MNDSDTKPRCVVCGRPIGYNRLVVRIARGMHRNGEFEERKLFGLAHERCFATSVEAPDLVLEELRRESGTQGTPR